MMYPRVQHIAVFAGLLLGVLPSAAQPVSAAAEVVPGVVMVGAPAQYQVRFVNLSQVPNLAPPRVDGLAFSPTMGTSLSTQIINGRRTVEAMASWTVRATRTGVFTIPGQTIQVGGQSVVIPPARLEAVPMDEETRSRALLLLDVPEQPWYAGQALPARLALLIRRDLEPVNIAFPERVGEAFVHSGMDGSPARGTLRRQGRDYQVFAWDILLTPIRSGPAELGFRQNIVIQAPSGDTRFPGLFSFPLGRTESLALQTDTLTAEILPLPRAGQPDSFAGAIGSFTVSAELDAVELTVGEPVTLTLHIEGKGNFDRIAAPELPAWDGWRIYPPKVSFTPTDPLGFAGRKSFEYILIPQSADITELPGFAYSSFDPVRRAYQTTAIPARPVTVRPAPPAPNGSLLARLGGRAAETASRVPEAILPLRTDPGRLRPAGPPLWRQPSFWLAHAAVALLLGTTAAVAARRNRRRSDSRLARLHAGSRQARHALAQARHAAKAGDAAAFFTAARGALQEAIGCLANPQGGAKTLVTSECMAILDRVNAPASLRKRAAALLEAADACQFAGRRPAPSELPGLAGELQRALAELDRLHKHHRP